jgi:hypothetical protein
LKRTFMKKNNLFVLGMLVITLAFGLVLSGCANPNDGGGGGDTTYTVSFAPNGGGGTAPSPLSGKSGEQITLPGQDNMTAPSATPFFKGWRAPNGTDYPPGAGYTITTGNVLLTAQWGTATTNYTVTFAFGRGSGTAPSPQSVASGTTIDLPGQSAMIAPSGGTFRGWSASTGGQTYNAGQSYPVTGNVTLTAQWGTGGGGTTYTVTFALGSGGGTAPSPQSAESGTTITLPGQGSMTPPTGKTFLEGWKAGTAGTQIYAPGYNYPVTGNITLTAQWGPTYTVTFDHGDGGGTPPSPQVVDPGTSIKLPGLGQMTAPAGKTFDGWKAGSGATQAAGTDVTINANTTYTAQWKTAPSGGELQEYFNGKLADFSMDQAIPVDTLLGMGAAYMGIEGVSTLAGLRASGGHLYINGTEVTSGTSIQTSFKLWI